MMASSSVGPTEAPKPKKKRACRHTRWVYSTSLQGNAVATWIEKICSGCGKMESVPLGALPGEEFREVYAKFHAK